MNVGILLCVFTKVIPCPRHVDIPAAAPEAGSVPWERVRYGADGVRPGILRSDIGRALG